MCANQLGPTKQRRLPSFLGSFVLVEFSFVFLLVEEPWVALDVFVDGSGHSSRVYVSMPLRVDDGIL